MFKHITHTTLYVTDQDEALAFYVGKLGMVVQTDADMDVMRYLTVTLPDDDSLELMLLLPGPPLHDEATAEQARELIAKGGAGGGVIFETDDCVDVYERLRDLGVEFTQEPTERFYGTDCALRDPFGNPLRFTERPATPARPADRAAAAPPR
jgi:catechol 2,3-dioxygenase-like lactoylglutathione lyase family enzyme